MKYQVNQMLNGCIPLSDEFNTKKEALELIAASVKVYGKTYKGTGYKKIGSVKEGLVMFKHPVHGIDYSIRLSKNK